MNRSTLLIGLDGATFHVLDPLMREGVMPSLQRVADTGVRATLRSVVPALTPPAWTSLVTGRLPGAHGIFDFFRKNAPASLHFGLLTSRDVASPPVWAIASEAGLRSTVLNFPLTFPPARIEGHLVPGGFMPWRQLRLGCHPADLFDRLRRLPRFNPRELALDMSEEAKAIEGCADEEYEAWIDMHIRRERQWVDIAQYLRQTEPADFTAVLFDGVDKLQHLCWRFIDPALAEGVRSAWERRVLEKCREYFRELDRRIEELMETFEPDATVVIASDHGFGAQVRTFFANSWLEQQGHLAWRTDQRPETTGPGALGLKELARHVYQMDWTRTRAFAPLPSGNGIHIVRADDEHPGGVSPDEYVAFRDRLAADLLAVTDPGTGERVVARVWAREEVFAGPFLELAPDLTLELEDGGLVSILSSPDAVRARPFPTGTHHRDGIFVARGPEYRHAAQLGTIGIPDVAPLLLHALALPLPASLDGRLPVEAIDPAALGRRPVHVSEGAAAAPAIADGELDEEAEAEVLKRLQALGYVE
jgi:predicted AlkP superfamily phosphohydrolase/phosphomutase